MGWLLDWLGRWGEDDWTVQEWEPAADEVGMPAPTITLPRPPRLNGTHISQLLASTTSALVQHRDTGAWRVAADLDDLATEDVPLRQHGFDWAAELLSAAEDEALVRGTSTARRTLLAAAGREASDELAAEYRREAELYRTTPACTVPMPRPTQEND